MSEDESPGPAWSLDEIEASNQGGLHPFALKGFEAFNARDYFQAHEDLETAWRAETGPARDVYRGILQVGLGYYHILRGNYRGAVKMFARCRPWLAPFPDSYLGIDLHRLREDYRRAESELLLLGPVRLHAFDRTLLRPLVFSPEIPPR